MGGLSPIGMVPVVPEATDSISGSEKPAANDRKLARACEDFEAILLSYLVKSMRSASALFDEKDEEAAAGLMTDFAEEHLAVALARSGGFGLAKAIQEKLVRKTGGEECPVRALHKVDTPPLEPARREFPKGLQGVVACAAEKYGLNPALLHAVIAQESGGRSDAVSAKGAKGLMQLMDATAKEMGVDDPFDPVANVLGGARYLRQLLDRWKGDLKLALASYNAGPAAVERHGGVPPYRETRAYVARVLERMESGIEG